MEPRGRPNPKCLEVSTQTDNDSAVIVRNDSLKCKDYSAVIKKVFKSCLKNGFLNYSGGRCNTYQFPAGKTISNGKILLLNGYIQDYEGRFSRWYTIPDDVSSAFPKNYFTLKDDCIVSPPNRQVCYHSSEATLYFQYLEFE